MKAPLPQKVPLVSQIAQVERELALRRSAYPRFVATHKMKQEHADLNMTQMEAVLLTLQWLQRNEALIKAMVEEAASAMNIEEQHQ